MSDERLAPVNGIEIAYQEIGNRDDPAIVLIMGLGAQMIAWDDGFCAMLAERGFRVVRFDNRDIGRSTKFREAGVPPRLDVLLGRRSSAAYLLIDMADDTLGLMDHLGIDAAHLVGASMGGMIAQEIAIDHPERVLSLASIMSTSGDRWHGWPTGRALAALMARIPRDREAYIERVAQLFRVIGSPGYPRDEEHLRELVSAAYDRGHHPAGIARQMHAITASGDRTSDLRRLRLPALVIHGTEDPLVRPSGGRATGEAIPGARLRMVRGMGHDFPRELWPFFVEEIVANARRTGEVEQAAA